MIEIWKNLDKEEEADVVLVNLSKCFDTINHSLLLTNKRMLFLQVLYN